MGNWYTVGLCLGLGLALGVVVTAILGANVLGVGAGAVVGAASAVFHDIPPWTVVGGNPARAIKQRTARQPLT